MIGHYLGIGFQHVLPWGADHMLLIVAMVFSDSKFKSALINCTIFTMAHSLTLALAYFKWIHVNVAMVELGIALSIFTYAITSIQQQQIASWQFYIIGLFGLLHGLGFASALMAYDLPKSEQIVALFGFNLGVEFAQIIIIILLFTLIVRPFSKSNWYHGKLRLPILYSVAASGLFWAIQRFTLI